MLKELNLNYLRQSLFGLVVVGLLCSIGMWILIQRHIETINGGRVALADPVAFETEAALTAIRNVSVLSPTGDAFFDNRTVVIDQGRIVSIVADGPVPDGARLIDGQGRFLIPGLIDAHVDLRRQPNDLLLYLANGITHVRDLAGQPEDLVLQGELEAGRVGPSLAVASPRLISAGLIEGGWISMTRPTINIRHPERAAQRVRELANEGYDAISIDSRMDLETFQAISSAANAIGLHTIGNLPAAFDLDRLSNTALSELARSEDLVEGLLGEFAEHAEREDPAAFLAQVEERGAQIADALMASDTAVTSTLWFTDTLARQAGDLVGALRDLPLEYANPAMVEGSRYAGVGWLPGMNRFELPRDLDSARRDRTIAIWQMRNQAHGILLRELAAGGVPIIAGSRATAELMIPGFSLHEELKTLNNNGLSPPEVLAAATRVPAARMGLEAGVIESGRPADLLLLRANPLADIANTRSIEMVIRAGRVFDRPSLDAMLKAVEQAHADSRQFELTRYQ